MLSEVTRLACGYTGTKHQSSRNPTDLLEFRTQALHLTCATLTTKIMTSAQGRVSNQDRLSCV